MEWLKASRLCVKHLEPFVLVTILKTHGSTPREAGVKMVITAQKSYGTIGGGNFEFSCIEQARSAIQKKDSSLFLKEAELGASYGQCCGGRLQVLFEPFLFPMKKLFLFGNGFVARELVKILRGLPVQIFWVDFREKDFPKKNRLAANIHIILEENYSAKAEEIEQQDLVLVMTHRHDLDLEVLKTVLSRVLPDFIGVIGSEKKRANFVQKLHKQGIPAEKTNQMVCPIGSKTQHKSPKAIAITVAAQLLSKF